ncbi:hypothetical protein PR048_008027 [Dryococelus australis]|uniref:Uncharacterized protein n=1 Tax=Dryococelus australis TaxID=614101 RepID=A0ABQ9HVX6_9NEOP|nr:hypothetical protein PR048_008027 [Dryococelus australis]
MRLKSRSRHFTSLPRPRPTACCDTADSSRQVTSASLFFVVASVKIQTMLLGKRQVVVRLDVVTLLVIREIETRQYLSTFFPDRSKFPKEFSNWLEFCKRKNFTAGPGACL